LNPVENFPKAEAWSLIAGQAGKGLVFAGIALFALALVASILRRERLAGVAFGLGTVTLFGTMAVLASLFLKDQFQYAYVFQRADKDTTWEYKLAGVWAGQQGSFLLWGCASAVFAWFAQRSAGVYRLAFLGVTSLFLGSLCGILAHETPFNLIPETIAHGAVMVPPSGVGLTPSLHNYWVVIHPPTIFLGFGLLLVPFAYAVAAMLTGNASDWVRQVRPWALTGIGVLALGICMGGFWAYETLGWGGFWMWDPVENVSVVPWIVLAAFVHGIIVQVARGRWTGANFFLGALPFLLFVYGTFLTRSGFLADVSVHSFAEMDKSARWILMLYLGAMAGGFIGLYLWKGRAAARAALREDAESGPASREGFYRFGALLLSMMALVIAVGMSWPFFMALSGQKSAVIEEWLYHRVIVFFFAPLMVLMGLAPFASWRGLGLGAVVSRAFTALCVSIFLTGIAVFAFRNPVWGVHALPDASINMPWGQAPLLPWMAFLTFLCLFCAVTSVWRITELSKGSKLGWGGFVAHFGLATLLAGLILSRGFEQKQRVFLREGEPQQALDYTITYKGATDPNMRDRNGRVLFDVKSESTSFEARPGLYYRATPQGEDEPMVWPHIHREFSHDVYFTLHPPVIFVWEKPERLTPGQSKEINGIKVEYLEPTRAGTPGTPGASFGAKLRVTADNTTKVVSPALELTADGPPRPSIELFNDDLAVTLMGMDAGSRAVDVQMLFTTPIYPIELFYKPMTALVWVGTGILTLGGLMAALARRTRRASAPVDAPETIRAPSKDIENAPLPAS
jgi:cytochrome c-type biogenesis protein CcmF